MDRAGGQSRPGRGFPCVAEGKLSSPLQISGVRRAETPSIPIPYISLRIRRAPPPTKTFLYLTMRVTWLDPAVTAGGLVQEVAIWSPLGQGVFLTEKIIPNFGEKGGAQFSIPNRPFGDA